MNSKAPRLLARLCCGKCRICAANLVLSLRTCFVSASDPEVRLDPQRSQQLRPSRRLADHSTSNRPTHSMGILLHTFGWAPTRINTVHLGYLKTNASYVAPNLLWPVSFFRGRTNEFTSIRFNNPPRNNFGHLHSWLHGGERQCTNPWQRILRI